MLYMAAGKPAHLGCKFLSDVSVVNSPIVVELLVITFLFCVVLPAESDDDDDDDNNNNNNINFVVILIVAFQLGCFIL